MNKRQQGFNYDGVTCHTIEGAMDEGRDRASEGSRQRSGETQEERGKQGEIEHGAAEGNQRTNASGPRRRNSSHVAMATGTPTHSPNAYTSTQEQTPAYIGADTHRQIGTPTHIAYGLIKKSLNAQGGRPKNDAWCSTEKRVKDVRHTGWPPSPPTSNQSTASHLASRQSTMSSSQLATTPSTAIHPARVSKPLSQSPTYPVRWG